jgi:hypothetical protein
MRRLPNKPCRCAKAAFEIVLRDKNTKKPLPGAVLALQSNCCPLFSLKSDSDGTLRFPSICPGIYTLVLTRAPKGYTLCGELPLLQVSMKGNLRHMGRTRRRLIIFFESESDNAPPLPDKPVQPMG